MRSVVPVILLLLSLVVVSSDAHAQVTRVSPSGCRGAAYPTPVGSTSVGSGFGVQCPPSTTNNVPFMVIGLRNVMQPITPPTACGGPCILTPRPDSFLPGVSAWRILIPRDPRLVGVCFYVQCGEADRRNSCVTLTGALEVCITR